VALSARRPRILLTGGSGQIGWELRRTLAPLGEVFAPPRADLDLADVPRLRGHVRDLAPRVVVNCGAYTDVERAEGEPAAARLLNVDAPAALALAAADAGALMVHLSTDYVFDGRKGAPYLETDPCAPLSVYGRTKLEGERAVTAAGGAHLVIRTSWVYGLRGRNFLRTIRNRAEAREALCVVDDQVGAPTWSRALAEGIAAVLARGGGADFATWDARGIYHLSASGKTSWHGFATAILAAAGGRAPPVVPVSTAEYGTVARRPGYSVLDCGNVERNFGVRLPHWRDQLELALGG
jgi:dTDP-4-dehydrorhamnose reductase